MVKRPNWAVPSWTVLTINEFALFSIFGSLCRRIEMLLKFAGSLSVVLSRMYVKRRQCRM